MSLAVVLNVVSEKMMDLINGWMVDKDNLTGMSKELYDLINEKEITTRSDFIVHWLKENNHISNEIYREAISEFRKRDIDGSGVLDLKDVQHSSTDQPGKIP